MPRLSSYLLSMNVIESVSIINRAVKLVHFYPILRHVPQLGVYACYKTYMVK